MSATPLFDRDGRWQPFDRLEIGLAHLIEELSGVGRQGLHVLALALREDRVEGERALARTRHAGHHHQPVSRELEIDVLQVVLPGSADADRA